MSDNMNVNYPETILEKSDGLTESESYLGILCSTTFLSLWSFPNLYRNQGRTSLGRAGAKGDGKELCDLLVVFENHIFIFSDKQCAFPNNNNAEVNWSRWYKKTIENSVKQIWGAERWILDYPSLIFLDKNCTKPFPFDIPNEI